MNPDFIKMLLAWGQGQRPEEVGGYSPEEQMGLMSQYPVGYHPGTDPTGNEYARAMTQRMGQQPYMQQFGAPARNIGFPQRPAIYQANGRPFSGGPQDLAAIGQNFNLKNWSAPAMANAQGRPFQGEYDTMMANHPNFGGGGTGGSGGGLFGGMKLGSMLRPR